MILAKGIYTGDGRVLLPAGTVLQESYINRLQQLEFKFVFVTDELLGEVQVKEVVSEPTLVELQQSTRDLLDKVRRIGKLDFNPVRKALDHVAYEVISNRNHLSNYYDWSHGDQLINHSVNVCILSLMLGLKMGYNTKQLDQLATGALLHDIGQILKNTPHQKTTNQDHTREGFIFLRDSGEISLLSAHIAFQHHENWDCSGRPRRLGGGDIHEYARIVAVADTYDLLIREQGLYACDAINNLQSLAGNRLDPEIVDLFLGIVPSYPLGTTVELSTREKGVVVDIPVECPSRPVVWLMDHLNKQAKELRLAEVPHVNVTSIVV